MKRSLLTLPVLVLAVTAAPSPAQAPPDVLCVGVRRLPQHLSPALAVTDEDLRAVELLFEGLVRVGQEKDGVSVFRPALADGPPRPAPSGRLFRLPPDARWSDDTPLTTRDVQRTVAAMRDKGRAARRAAYGELLQPVILDRPDPREVVLRLTQGYFEPLSLMTFKVLPEAALRPGNAADFAKHPVGSGPFRLGGRDEKTHTLTFAVNPNHQRAVTPSLHEVRFVETADPVGALERGEVDLLTDLTPEQALRVRDGGKGRLLPPGTNRRVCFLAVNVTEGPLLDKVEFRRALAKAVPRQRLLETYFRREPRRQSVVAVRRWYQPPPPPPPEPRSVETRDVRYHHELAGPYPAGCWAEAPGVGQELLAASAPEEAAARAKDILKQVDKNKTDLELLYPDGDPLLKAALEDLAADVGARLGVTITARALPPDQLRDKVEQGAYQLAYWHYDYPDDTFWPEPLLGAAGPHGDGNLFRYNSDAVRAELRRLREKRDPAEVRDALHAVHKRFLSDLPFVPLWQLDPLTAAGPRVTPPPSFEANLLFGEIERWSCR